MLVPLAAALLAPEDAGAIVTSGVLSLVAGVAHEIDNPLSFVRSNLACLDRAVSGEEPLVPSEQKEIASRSSCRSRPRRDQPQVPE